MTEPARVEQEDDMDLTPAREDGSAAGNAWDALLELFAQHGARATWAGEPKEVR